MSRRPKKDAPEFLQTLLARRVYLDETRREDWDDLSIDTQNEAVGRAVAHLCALDEMGLHPRDLEARIAGLERELETGVRIGATRLGFRCIETIRWALRAAITQSSKTLKIMEKDELDTSEVDERLATLKNLAKLLDPNATVDGLAETEVGEKSDARQIEIPTVGVEEGDPFGGDALPPEGEEEEPTHERAVELAHQALLRLDEHSHVPLEVLATWPGEVLGAIPLYVDVLSDTLVDTAGEPPEDVEVPEPPQELRDWRALAHLGGWRVGEAVEEYDAMAQGTVFLESGLFYATPEGLTPLGPDAAELTWFVHNGKKTLGFYPNEHRAVEAARSINSRYLQRTAPAEGEEDFAPSPAVVRGALERAGYLVPMEILERFRDADLERAIRFAYTVKEPPGYVRPAFSDLPPDQYEATAGAFPDALARLTWEADEVLDEVGGRIWHATGFGPDAHLHPGGWAGDEEPRPSALDEYVTADDAWLAPGAVVEALVLAKVFVGADVVSSWSDVQRAAARAWAQAAAGADELEAERPAPPEFLAAHIRAPRYVVEGKRKPVLIRDTETGQVVQDGLAVHEARGLAESWNAAGRLQEEELGQGQNPEAGSGPDGQEENDGDDLAAVRERRAADDEARRLARAGDEDLTVDGPFRFYLASGIGAWVLVDRITGKAPRSQKSKRAAETIARQFNGIEAAPADVRREIVGLDVDALYERLRAGGEETAQDALVLASIVGHGDRDETIEQVVQWSGGISDEDLQADIASIVGDKTADEVKGVGRYAAKAVDGVPKLVAAVNGQNAALLDTGDYVAAVRRLLRIPHPAEPARPTKEDVLAGGFCTNCFTDMEPSEEGNRCPNREAPGPGECEAA